MKNTYINIPLPAGTYFIGDPCYVIKDFGEKEISDSNLIQKKGEDHFIAFERGDGGIHIIGGSSESDEAGDDSGMFGIVPESLWTDHDIVNRIKQGENGLGFVATFSQPIMFKKVEDIVLLGNYAVDLSFYNTSMFEEYDHDVDKPNLGIDSDGDNWQLWGQYDKDGELQAEGIDMGDEYWETIGINSEEAES